MLIELYRYVGPYLDWTMLVLILALAWRFPLLGNRWLTGIERFASRFASRKRLAIIVIALFVMLARVSLLPLVPVRPPGIHDELSYLLQGDTFAHGRLTNPPHPMAFYLDTFHVLQQPTYASMYPPAQGAVLALGELLGNPWIGVVLSMGAMFAALLWMLQAWVPSEWALLGVTLLFFRIGVFSYWMNSYWGGAVACLGGALVMGALPRILKRPQVSDAIWMGLGIAILANSRPFEGLVLCVPVSVVLVTWIWNRWHGWQTDLLRAALPLGAILICMVGFMLYYNWRVTQHPLLFPHSLDDRVHLSMSEFVWPKQPPPMHYANPQFDAFYNHWTRNQYTHNWNDFLRITARKFQDFQDFFLGATLTIPFVALPWVLLDRRMRLPLLQLALYCAAAIAVVWFSPHYAAPVVGVFLVVLVQTLRHLRRWTHRGRPIGIGLTRAIVLCAASCLVFGALQTAKYPTGPLYGGWGWFGLWDRAAIEAKLEGTPGEHLVVVRYGHNEVAREWVYNNADIDHSKVVWARYIPGADMQPLLDYFKNRTVWLVDVGNTSARLATYPR